MDLENIKISDTTDGSITLSADTVINPLTWTTITGTTFPNYTTVSTTTTTPIDSYRDELNKAISLIAPTETVKPKKGKIDPRLEKINKEIKELRNKTWFYSIKEYVPNKVYGFTFPYSYQKNEYKTICADEDEFNLEFAFFLAYAKYLNNNELTTEGYVDIARTLSYNKRNLKKVKNGIKLFYKLKERDAIEEQIKAEKKHRHDKLVQKKIEKRNRKKDEQIKIIRTAIEASKQKF